MTWTIRKILVLITLTFSLGMVGALVWITDTYQRFTSSTLTNLTARITENLVHQQIENHINKDVVPFVEEWALLSTLSKGITENDKNKLKFSADRMFNTIEVINKVVHLRSVAIYDHNMNLLTMDTKGSRESLHEFPERIDRLRARPSSEKRIGFRILWQTSGGRPVHSMIAPIGGFRLLGFIEFVTNPIETLSGLGDAVGGVFELRSGIGKILIKSSPTNHSNNLHNGSTNSSGSDGAGIDLETLNIAIHGTDGEPWADGTITRDVSAFNESVGVLQNQAIGFIVVISLAILMLAWFLLHFYVFDKIKGFANVLESLADGNTNVDAPAKGRGEFGALRSALESLRTAVLMKQTLQLKSDAELVKQKKMEADLRISIERAETANVAKSEFLAAMSHEIRTPMAGVIGMADLILDTDLSLRLLDWATSIKSSGENLLSILNGILDQSKLEAGKLEISPTDFHLASFIHDTTQLFSHSAKGKNLKLDVKLDSALPEGLNADRMRIGQVLSNLMSNAIKFTETGTISVHAQHQPVDGLNFFLRIDVTDSGIGLHVDEQDKIFSAFTQADGSTSRKYGGTGLGLSISKQLTELMGGEIGVESVKEEGSTFWFTTLCAPALGAVEAPDKRRSLDRWVSSRSLKVLVAEDNITNQQLIRAIFENLNHDITLVSNGISVIEQVEAGNFDIIVMDIRMPVMDGLQATTIIRAMDSKKSNIPIIALTADIAAGTLKDYADAGMNEVCSKPLNLPILLKAMNKHLGEEIHTSIPNAISLKPKTKDLDRSEVGSFSEVLDRVSNIVDQRSNHEILDGTPKIEIAGVDEGLLAELATEYVSDVMSRCDEIRLSLGDLIKNPGNDKAKALVSEASHGLIGQGGTFGCHLITEIATEADKLLKESGRLKPEGVRNLNNHLEAISLIVEKGITGHGGKVGRILLQGLKDHS